MGKIIQNYSIQQLIGQGVYGKVYKAVHIKTKQQVAIKVINAQKFKQIPKLQQCTVNQINILSNMQNCPYIVKYIDMLKTVNNFYFVYEFCNGGTLDKLMKTQGPLSEKKALLFFKQLLQAFKLLSKNNIMHRDLKPDNIFIHNGTLKLGDFGFCKPLDNHQKMAQTMLGSPIYMAPQVLKGQSYNMQADIWSLGVVLYQMLYGKCPFQSKSIAKLIELLNLSDLVIPETPKISGILEKLLKRMLVKDYKGRIDWAELFQYNISQNGEIYLVGKNGVGNHNNINTNNTNNSNNNGVYQNNQQQLQLPLNQFQLRSSIKNSSDLGALFHNNKYQNSIQSSTSLQSSGSTNINSNSMSNHQNLLSPKMTKGYDINFQQSRNLMMLKKKSPMKNDHQISINNNNISTNISNSGNLINQPKINSPYYKNQLYSKQSINRLDMLIKSHAKLLPIIQIALDCLRTQKQRIIVSYLLFKNIQKQIYLIFDSLKKQSYDPRTEQFRSTLEKEIQNIKLILNNFKELIKDQEYINVLGNIDQPNKSKVIKNFYENMKVQTQEEVILAAQIIDYLDEGLLIKKDSYERMGKDTLLKQVKNKFLKYL